MNFQQLRSIREAVRRQAPLLTRHPTSDAAADVERLARALIQTTQPGAG